MKTLTLCALCCLLLNHVHGATINAASASRADVGTAVASSADGDTVVVPSGTVDWFETLTVNKAITLQGSGVGQTLITDQITNSPNFSIIRFDTVAGKSYRLTGIQFERGATRSADQGALRLTGASTAMRVDHCFWNNVANENIVTKGTYGVIDHCTFNLTQFGKRALMSFNGNVGGGSNGDTSWQASSDWGGPNAMYVEDCEILKPGGVIFYSAFDGWEGGRAVIRFNYLKNLRISNHGTETSQRLRSMRKMEIYSNIISNIDYTIGDGADSAIVFRGGGGLVFSNTISGAFNVAMQVNSYRNVGGFPPWGVVDGTKAWDGSDGTIYESGQATGGGSLSLTDATKSWTVNQWNDHLLRQVYTNTATSGGVRSVVVSGAGWTVNQWQNYEITKVSTDEKSSVASNTSDTLTLSSSYYALNMSGGGAFILSRAREILSNTATTLTVGNQTDLSPPTFASGQYYQIRKATFAMDQPGRGQTTALSGSPANHQNLSQPLDPIYQWANTWNGSTFNISPAGYGTLVVNRDFYNNTAQPGYTPYTYPHPLVSTNTPPPTPPTSTGHSGRRIQVLR